MQNPDQTLAEALPGGAFIDRDRRGDGQHQQPVRAVMPLFRWYFARPIKQPGA
jgi:hypothetical protein